MGTTDKETPAAPAPATVMPIMTMDRVQRMIHEHSQVDVDSLPGSYSASGKFGFPKIGGTYQVDLANGRRIEKDLTIDVANEKRFAYAYLTLDDLGSPMFAGFRMVTRGSEASRTSDGKSIPESYWQGQDVVRSHETFLCFAKAGYYHDLKKVGQDGAIERLKRFAPGETMSDSTQKVNGELIGRVVNKEMSVKLKK